MLTTRRLLADLWWHVYYGWLARADAILHKIRHPSHHVVWHEDADEFCSGDISCKTCNLGYWCRANHPLQTTRIGQWWCSVRTGHATSSTGDWKTSQWDEAAQDFVWKPTPDPDPPFCIRCNAPLT